MGDIDFDELDKAVNSLMGSGNVPADKKKANPRHKVPKAAEVHSRNVSATARPSLASTSAPNAAAKTMDVRFTPSKPVTAAPAMRRVGRFMDVVDSSSELNPIRKPIVSPPREVPRKIEPAMTERVEPTIEPLRAQPIVPSFVSNPETAVQTTQPEPTERAESKNEAVQVRLVAKSAPVPDPLQLLQEHTSGSTVEIIKDNETEDDNIRPVAVFGAPVSPNTADDSLSVPVTVSPKLVVTTPGPSWHEEEHVEIVEEVTNPPETVDNSLVSEVLAQLNEEIKPQENESPFLLDTKPEKRPLGANQAVVSDKVEPLTTQLQAGQTGPIEYPMPALPHEQPEVSQVPELSNELVALEATGKADYELDEAPVPIKSSTDGSQKKEIVAGPTSIAQQYQSKESSGDSTHAPIYDASEYAEPVTHPAKKKSGWIWVLVIFLILALASGGAVTFYLTGIIP